MKTILRTGRLSMLLVFFALVPSLASAAVDPVSILDNSYSPQNITVNPGDTVVWTDYGSLAHTVIADNGAFSSGTITPGVNFAYIFNTPGTYTYHDSSYGAAGGVGMSGMVNVTGGAMTGSTVTTSSSANPAALQAEAQVLLAKIAALQAEINANGGSGTAAAVTTINSSSCPNIGRTLRLGSSGSDVSRLQQFLAENPTIYPEGIVSGYYGLLTQTAVQNWQIQYNIVSSGTPSTTGFGVVGPRTAAAIALLCSTGSTSGSSTSVTDNAPTVGGTIQVSPITGPAPLTVNVMTTVNTVSSCSGSTYVLNYGDSSLPVNIPTSPSDCQPVQQTFTHTYTAAGTYTVALSSGAHQSTATVTVGGAVQATPADSMQASITSGPAPLAVVFTGTVASPASLGCSGSCSDTINFGDGAVGLVQIPATAGTWQSYVIDHTYSAPGTYSAQLESVTGSPDGSAITITASTPANDLGGSYQLGTVTTVSAPYGISVTASLPACGAYLISWGDGSASTSGTGSCTAGGTTITVPHTYPTQAASTNNTYTITLQNGSGAVEGNPSSFSIST